MPAFVKLNQLSDKFFDHVWIPERDIGNMRVNLSFTPTYTYTRADCPQYAGLKGPSCFTAPLVPTRPELPDVLLPQNYQPPADLAPPPGTVVGSQRQPGRGGPAAGQCRTPAWPIRIRHCRRGWRPRAPVPGTANPALVPTPPPPVPAVTAGARWRPARATAAARQAEAAEARVAFGGNVGPGRQPAGTATMLSASTGQPATTAQPNCCSAR